MTRFRDADLRREAWQRANRDELMAAVNEVRASLEQHSRSSKGTPEGGEETPPSRPDASQPGASRSERSRPDLPRPALDVVTELFGLSTFERRVLVLCAALELDGSFPALCARAQGNPERPFPTFGLALAVLPEAHWSALGHRSPLRRWRLVELGAGTGLTVRQLTIDERILHYLAGVDQPDDQLARLVEPVETDDDLVDSHQALAEQIAAVWVHARRGDGLPPELPLVQLVGEEAAAKQAIAAAACAGLGLPLYRLPIEAVPANPGELEDLVRLWDREVRLSPAVVLLDADEVDPANGGREHVIARMVEDPSRAVILTGRERRPPRRRQRLTFEVEKPNRDEQRRLWRRLTESAGADLDGKLDDLVGQFHLSAAGIRSVCLEALGRLEVSRRREARGAAPGEGREGGGPAAAPSGIDRLLWNTCRTQARPRLDDLARRIEPRAGWEDLQLPERQRTLLKEISAQLRHRVQVYDRWGFASRSSRGLGISALFAGASGTGKTLAAEVLAREVELDLYFIDLSSVVSKYIGETEKNLRRLFDAAEGAGAILLFDEADALFGKRSEVKDSHDRYANIEVSYLLQRMESYHGLAILTTNLKDALDTAFLRRLRFIVEFPFPGVAERTAIWRRIFPGDVPTERLDVDKLARLNLAGGNIRSIALGAAFLAADEGAAVTMAHLLAAARREYAKLGRPLPELETRDW